MLSFKEMTEEQLHTIVDANAVCNPKAAQLPDQSFHACVAARDFLLEEKNERESDKVRSLHNHMWLPYRKKWFLCEQLVIPEWRGPHYKSIPVIIPTSHTLGSQVVHISQSYSYPYPHPPNQVIILYL